MYFLPWERNTPSSGVKSLHRSNETFQSGNCVRTRIDTIRCAIQLRANRVYSRRPQQTRNQRRLVCVAALLAQHSCQLKSDWGDQRIGLVTAHSSSVKAHFIARKKKENSINEIDRRQANRHAQRRASKAPFQLFECIKCRA